MGHQLSDTPKINFPMTLSTRNNSAFTHPGYGPGRRSEGPPIAPQWKIIPTSEGQEQHQSLVDFLLLYPLCYQGLIFHVVLVRYAARYAEARNCERREGAVALYHGCISSLFYSQFPSRQPVGRRQHSIAQRCGACSAKRHVL